ncbi:MAG: hypothetical protein ACM34O_10395 [Ignavibacteria bacterium]
MRNVNRILRNSRNYHDVESNRTRMKRIRLIITDLIRLICNIRVLFLKNFFYY